MRLSEIEFGSLLTYCPHGSSSEIQRSKDLMITLKTGGFVADPNSEQQRVPISEWIARTIDENRSTLQFADFFSDGAILVPIPRSSLMQPNTLWVPLQIADALVRRGLGTRVVSYLKRVTAIPKSAFSRAGERPSVTEHFNSLQVEGSLTPPKKIVLIDDIVTRGQTIMGSANRLSEAFPNVRIKAFVAIRTISNPSEFARIYDPCLGTITYREQYDDTIRRS